MGSIALFTLASKALNVFGSRAARSFNSWAMNASSITELTTVKSALLATGTDTNLTRADPGVFGLACVF